MEPGPVKNPPPVKVIRLDARIVENPSRDNLCERPFLEIECMVETHTNAIISHDGGEKETLRIPEHRSVWLQIPISAFWQLGRDCVTPLRILKRDEIDTRPKMDLENLQKWEPSDIRVQVDEDEKPLTESHQPKKCDPPVVPPTKPSKQCGCEAGPCKECSKNVDYTISGATIQKQPFKCPVCNGVGSVSYPPHIAGDCPTFTGSYVQVYICHACQGTGVVWG